jgi:hypothetical protein
MSFRLRSLMLLVALTAIGLWVAIEISQIGSAMLMTLGESTVVALLAYAILVLGVITALSLVVSAVIGVALCLRVVLRDSSQRSGCSRPGRRDNRIESSAPSN